MPPGHEYESTQDHDFEESRPLWNVLSLDGGGVRGLAELLILKNIFRVMANIQNTKEELLPCDYFDLIGGTSTGGLIALMLGRLKLKLPQAIEAFRIISVATFPPERKKWTSLKIGTGGFVYDEETFATEVKKIVSFSEGNENMALEEVTEPKCRVFVCITKQSGNTQLLRSYDLIDDTYSPHSPIKIWEAARATSAAPLLFKPMTFEGPGQSKRTVYDGALTENNPIQQVMNECGRLGRDREVGCVVSLGTGVKANAGLKDSNHLLKLAITLAKAATHCDKIQRRFIESNEGQRLKRQRKYFRFDIARDLDEIGLDDWESFDAIRDFVEEYVKDNHDEIRRCAELLLSSRTEATLRPNLSAQRSTSAQNPPRPTNQATERFRRDAQASAVSLPAPSTIAGSRHSRFPHENVRLSELRAAAHDTTASIFSDSQTVGQLSLLTLDGDAKEIIDGEIKKADEFVGRREFTQAYPKFQRALNLLSHCPEHLQSSLRCDAHLGMAECRSSASDSKTKESALEYLKSAEKHALEALDYADEASIPATRMSLLATAIRRAEREAEPGRVDPGKVGDLRGQVTEQIEMLRQLINREDGPARSRNYEELLERGEALQRKVETMAAS